MKNWTKMNKNFTNPEFIQYGTDIEMDKLADNEICYDHIKAAK